ncbi:MAG: hypothetical protein HFH54_02955 [Lachnospiraceae bacterium]|nr:hypothetical protein [Lachnospiraceae bacterium]
MDFLTDGKVSIAMTKCYKYPDKKTFFRPDTLYPEYYFGSECIASERNEVYATVRRSLWQLGLDKEHYGTKEWNPLKEFVRPGDSVLIKPNLVMDHNNLEKGQIVCIRSRPS